MGKLVKWLVFAGLGLAGLAGGTLMDAGLKSSGNAAMAPAATKPPLDLAQPARTATATFALG